MTQSGLHPGRAHVSAQLALSNFSSEVSGSCEVRRRGPLQARVGSPRDSHVR